MMAGSSGMQVDQVAQCSPLKQVGACILFDDLTRLSPSLAVIDHPIHQCLIEPNIVARFLGFNPFVLENLFALGLKLFIKGKILNELGFLGVLSHVLSKN
mgnify:CR=1 FL=1